MPVQYYNHVSVSQNVFAIKKRIRQLCYVIEKLFTKLLNLKVFFAQI